ncbi:hypothetical protein GE09DRAFT_1080032 [Coniochaeta sp. 2T2.1]|nr:hypothetical protein GE09DRAFT_1080032 [Coniochaeta sp. 2T2.1]
MAAPPSKTVGDLTGKWVMNKTLSDSAEPALALQGIGWMTRKAVGFATLTLDIKQYTAPPSPPNSSPDAVTHIEIEQTGTGGLKGTTEKRCLDHQWREHSDWMFGHVKGQTKFLKAEEVTDEYLKKGWLEGEGENKGPGGESHIESYVESLESGWTARQVWGFQEIEGVRRYCRNIVVEKGAERVEIRLVYDFLE